MDCDLEEDQTCEEDPIGYLRNYWRFQQEVIESKRRNKNILSLGQKCALITERERPHGTMIVRINIQLLHAAFC